jgi:hypothetical protein
VEDKQLRHLPKSSSGGDRLPRIGWEEESSAPWAPPGMRYHLLKAIRINPRAATEIAGRNGWDGTKPGRELRRDAAPRVGLLQGRDRAKAGRQLWGDAAPSSAHLLLGHRRWRRLAALEDTPGRPAPAGDDSHQAVVVARPPLPPPPCSMCPLLRRHCCSRGGNRDGRATNDNVVAWPRGWGRRRHEVVVHLAEVVEVIVTE